MIYRVSRFICLVILKALFRLEIIGRENIPEKGPFIFASNHVSYLDPVVVGVASFRKVVFLAKEELFKLPFFSALLHLLSCLPLKRSRFDISALKQSLAALKRGLPIVIFPQGTRSREESRVHAGVGFLSLKSGAPVIPVKVCNTDKALPPGKIVPSFCKIRAIIGKPYFADNSMSYEEIAKEVFKLVSGLDFIHKKE